MKLVTHADPGHRPTKKKILRSATEKNSAARLFAFKVITRIFHCIYPRVCAKDICALYAPNARLEL